MVATERGIAGGWAEAAMGASLTVLVICCITGPFERGLRLAERVLALEGLGEERGRLIYQIGVWNHGSTRQFGRLTDLSLLQAPQAPTPAPPGAAPAQKDP